MPARALASAAVFIVLASCVHHRPPAMPEPPTPTPQGPSQSAADAKRDGVPLEVARMTLDQRTALENNQTVSPSITTDEGVWKIAQPSAGLNYLYGEVLLLNRDRTKILKAFPMRDAPPYNLAVNANAVYCARAGDGALPDTTICRIDRKTHAFKLKAYHPYLELYDFRVDDAEVWAKDAHGTWTKIDAVTLEVVARGLKGPSG